MSPARFFFVLVVAFAGAAGARTVEGTVREAGTRKPIPAAFVSAPQADVETVTDDQGGFLLEIGEGTGALTLVVETGGYLRRTEVVRLEKGVTARVDVFLEPDVDAVATVVRERRQRADVARGAHRIDGREVNELPGTYGDPAKAIENFPGMGRVLLSQGSLFIRGAEPAESAVYVDDYEIPDLYHYTGSTSVINIPFVESVELVPGGFSSRYGRATGGLVTLKTRKLPTDDVHGFAKLDVIDGGAYVGVPLSKKTAVGASARRSWLDAIRQVQRATTGTGEDVLLIPTYWDYQLKLDADLAPGSEVVVFAFGSGDREEYVRDLGANVDAYRRTNDSDFHRVAVTWKQSVFGGATHQVTPVVGYERQTLEEGSGLRRRERTTFDVQVRDELVVRTGTSRVVAGVDATLRHDAFAYGGLLADDGVRELPSADDERVAFRRSRREVARGTLGLYTEGTFEPLDDLELTPGLRLDGYWIDDLPELSIEPRFAALWRVVDDPWGTAIRGAGGVFGRPPDPEDVAAAHAAGTRLPPQHAFQLQAGFEQGLGAGRAFTSTLYTAWRDELVTRAPTFPRAPSPGQPAVVAGGSGLSYGLELLLRSSLPGRYSAWVSYALQRHERTDGAGPFAASHPYPAAYDTTHLLALVGQTSLIWGFRVGGRYRIATGMPRTDVIGAVYDADSGAYLPLEGPRGGARFPFFHALDVRVDWSVLLPWFELDVYADLVNVLNLRGEEGRIYDYDYARSTPRLGLPTIPMVGAKLTF